MAEDVNKEEERSCFSSETLATFVKFVLVKGLLLSLYTLDISSDLAVAYEDYLEGDAIFGYITAGLVFSPGFFFSLYMFCDSFWRFSGDISCLKGVLWLLACPMLPLWPIFRDLKHILLGLKATLLPRERQAIIKRLKAPSRTYLLKFLEAFTEAAPQLVVRLLKICLNNPFAFVGFRKAEIIQITFSLIILSLNVIATHQKNVSTKQVMNGELESPRKYSLSCIGQIFAFCWWLTFLWTRIQAIVLFISAYNYWIFLIVGIHVMMMFVIQTIYTTKETIRRIFIYFFGAFVFIFAYVQFNLTSKVKIGAWVSYVIFSVVVFVENIAMLTCWLFKQNSMMHINVAMLQHGDNATLQYSASKNGTYSSYVTGNLNDTEALQNSIEHHNEKLLFVHYGLFAVSLIFMILTFMCPFTNVDDNKDRHENSGDGNDEELTQFS